LSIDIGLLKSNLWNWVMVIQFSSNWKIWWGYPWLELLFEQTFLKAEEVLRKMLVYIWFYYLLVYPLLSACWFRNPKLLWIFVILEIYLVHLTHVWMVSSDLVQLRIVLLKWRINRIVDEVRLIFFNLGKRLERTERRRVRVILLFDFVTQNSLRVNI
jgi:hypothetical protein